MSGEDRSSRVEPEIGRRLRLAREERGLSLQQVEDATKIRAKYLRELEHENFDVLPAVYVLGSLKTYADYLRLDGAALVRELKRRQAPPQEERDPADEGPSENERGGPLAFLGRLLGIGSPQITEDDTGPIPVIGPGFRPYLGLGAVLIFVLAMEFAPTLAGGAQPAVSRVHEPTISQTSSRITLAGGVKDERSTVHKTKEGGPVEKPASPKSTGKDEKNKVEKDEQEEHGAPQTAQSDRDLAVSTPPQTIASANASPSATASASASPAATASAIASAIASAGASAGASPVATASASATATPEPATAQPAPATVPPAPAAARASNGAGRGVASGVPAADSAPSPGGVNGTRLANRIVGRAMSVVNSTRRSFP